MYYLTIGSCLKQEESYIMDFIKYHRYIGVEHFVFFDREYHPLHDLLKNESDVEIFHFPENAVNVHAQAWAQLIGYNKGKTKWLACIDADEVLVPVNTDNVQNILKTYEEFASLQINWKIAASNGFEKREPGSLYERFTLFSKPSEGVNEHTQFICQPDRTMPYKTHDPHHPILPSNEMSVNTNGQRVQGPFNRPAVHDVLWCAHYITKSREEWIIKNAKGRADIFGEKMPFQQHWDDHNKIGNEEKETRVLQLWNKANEKI